jgi:regulator of sigma E protease
MPAGISGIKSGDVVTAVDGVQIEYWDELTDAIKAKKGEALTLTVQRGNESLEKLIEVDTSGVVGIQVSSDLASHGLKEQKFKFGFLAAVSAGISDGNETLTDYIASLKFIFTKKGATGLGGVGTIANLYGSTWDWTTFWTTTAFLSFMLAFLNLLPIPALDGGHVMFLLVEMVTGRALPQKFLEYAQMIGFLLLMGLILYANGLDLLRGLNLW